MSSMVKVHDFIFTKLTRLLLVVSTRLRSCERFMVLFSRMFSKSEILCFDKKEHMVLYGALNNSVEGFVNIFLYSVGGCRRLI